MMDEILSIADQRLVRINPREENFFKNVLNYSYRQRISPEIRKYIECYIKPLEKVTISPFYKPIYYPSIKEEEVIFTNEENLPFGHSFDFWKEKVSKMPDVNGYHWRVETLYEYGTFIIYIINRLVEKGYGIHETLSMIVEKYPGAYLKERLAEIGIFNLGNVVTMLEDNTYTMDRFWLAGLYFSDTGPTYNMSSYNYCEDFQKDFKKLRTLPGIILK